MFFSLSLSIPSWQKLSLEDAFHTSEGRYPIIAPYFKPRKSSNHPLFPIQTRVMDLGVYCTLLVHWHQHPPSENFTVGVSSFLRVSISQNCYTLYHLFSPGSAICLSKHQLLFAEQENSSRWHSSNFSWDDWVYLPDTLNDLDCELRGESKPSQAICLWSVHELNSFGL